MSFLDLYMNKNPMITASDDNSAPVATIFGIPFDSTHSYKPGCRFGPDTIRDSLGPPVDLLELDVHINDKEFATAVLGIFDGWIEAGKISREVAPC